MKQFGRRIIFFLLTLILFLVAHQYTKSPGELFYLLLFPYVCSFILIFKRKIINRIKLRQVIRLLIPLIIIIIFAIYFASLLGGKIVFHEFIIIIHFLLSFGVILIASHLLITKGVSWITTKISPHIFRSNKPLELISENSLRILLVIFLIFPYILSVLEIHRIKVTDKKNPSSLYGYQYEDIEVLTRDQLKIKGWFIPDKASRKSVIICHGLGANKSNFLPTIDLWRKQGYSVVIFDFRGHGASNGHTTTFGLKEKEDVLAVFNYLQTKSELDQDQIYGYGLSMGSAPLIYAAAENNGFKMLILDSPYADLTTMSREIMAKFKIIPRPISEVMRKISLCFVSLDVGFNIIKVSPKNQIPNILSTPLLIIHGKNDRIIPHEQSLILYENARTDKELWLVDDMDHMEALFGHPSYSEKIFGFIKKHSSGEN
ncbi:MAG: alpha/beta hydrolase [Planctomycetes bacterium]|nr:alpha/beta hydrolase [Planctomycetota bacterium]